MKIPEIGEILLNRTNEVHFGQTKVQSVTNVRANKNSAINQVEPKKSFESYLLEAMNSVNSQQNSVSQLQEQVITNPDSVDIHDVTIAMSKARMSLELTQNVINTLVTSWNEITTTR